MLLASSLSEGAMLMKLELMLRVMLTEAGTELDVVVVVSRVVIRRPEGGR